MSDSSVCTHVAVHVATDVSLNVICASVIEVVSSVPCHSIEPLFVLLRWSSVAEHDIGSGFADSVRAYEVIGEAPPDEAKISWALSGC